MFTVLMTFKKHDRQFNEVDSNKHPAGMANEIQFQIPDKQIRLPTGATFVFFHSMFSRDDKQNSFSTSLRDALR